MDWFNTMLASMLTYCPRWMARPFAQPYVAGETIEDVLVTIEGILKPSGINIVAFMKLLKTSMEIVQSP